MNLSPPPIESGWGNDSKSGPTQIWALWFLHVWKRLTNGDEGGSWTFSDVSGAGLTFASQSGSYTKNANIVVVKGAVTYPVTANAAVASLSLPVRVSTGYFIGSAIVTNGTPIVCVANTGSLTLGFDNLSAVQITNAGLSGATVYFTVTYLS